MKHSDAVKSTDPEISPNAPRQPDVNPAIRNYIIKTYVKIITTLGEGAKPKAIQIMATYLTDHMPYAWSNFDRELQFLRDCAEILGQPAWYGGNVPEEVQVDIVTYAIRHMDDRQNAQSQHGASFLGSLAESLRNARTENIFPPMI